MTQLAVIVRSSQSRTFFLLLHANNFVYNKEGTQLKIEKAGEFYRISKGDFTSVNDWQHLKLHLFAFNVVSSVYVASY